MISDYCRVCLKKYPELKPRALSCALPKCVYYEPYGKISIKNIFTPFGNYDKGSYCALLKKRVIIPIINCPNHKERGNV